MDEEFDAVPLELSETFISGFRLGAKMMIEIFEYKLGLDKIYIQAKRWDTEKTVGRPELQKFVGH